MSIWLVVALFVLFFVALIYSNVKMLRWWDKRIERLNTPEGAERKAAKKR